MGDGYNFQVLKREILNRSKARDWETAKKEWRLTDIYEAEESETCLCEHFPIREICVIHNGTTGQTTEVGNVCVMSCTRFRRHRVRCFMEQEVCHGETAVYAGVQA